METLAEKYPDATIVRAYWLGRIDPAEAARYESEWFASDDIADYLAAIRDELIEEHLAGELNDEDEAAFRSYFLQSPAHVQMLAFSDAYDRAMSESALSTDDIDTAPGFLSGLADSLRALFRSPVLGLAAGALLIATIGLVLFFGSDISTDKLGTVVVVRDDNGNSTYGHLAAVNAEPLPNDPNLDAAVTPTPRQRPRVQIATIILSGISRDGEDNIPESKLADDTATFRLVFPVPPISESFESYRAEVTSDSGRQIFSQALQDLEYVARDSKLSVDVPALRLGRGTYSLTIIGKRKDQPNETLHRSRFKIN